MAYWDAPSEEYLNWRSPSEDRALSAARTQAPKEMGAEQMVIKEPIAKEVSAKEEGAKETVQAPRRSSETTGWSFHDATSLTPGADRSRAAKLAAKLAAEQRERARASQRPKGGKGRSKGPQRVDGDEAPDTLTLTLTLSLTIYPIT